MIKHYLLISCALLCSLFVSAQTVFERSMVFEGNIRTYRIFVPRTYSAARPVPLVLNLHGYGSNAFEQEFYSNLRGVADTAGFIIVHPNGLVDALGRQYWNTFDAPGQNANDLGFFNLLLDSMQANFNIDRNRIYSTGMSNGGFMSYELACRMSNRIAAVASVTGSMLNNRITSCNPGRPVPAMQIHGTADPTVPYNGSVLNRFAPIETVVNFWVQNNGCNPTPLIIPVPNSNTTDLSTAERRLYTGGRAGSTVEFYRVENGGHTWPGALIAIGVTNNDFVASVEIWRFFNQFRLNQLTNTDAPPSYNTLLATASPNPFTDQLRIYLPETVNAAGQAQIFDMLGRLQASSVVPSGSNMLELPSADWSSGVYYVRLAIGDRRGVVAVVKQ
jgi:polyhydroxybutyrate depolymerase